MSWLSAWRTSRAAQCPVVGNGQASGPVRVRTVESRADLDRFVRLPWRIYDRDPYWVPPLIIEVKEFLDRARHPFYLHGDARSWIAERDGVTVGRILASDDPRYNATHGTNLGCFGMFESVDEGEVATALLDAASDWLRARGRTAILGPVDYSLNYPSGLLVEGFETPPRVLMNHNPRYYAPLLEAWGLTKAKDLYSWWFADPYDMVSLWRRRAEWLARRSKVTVRAFRKADFDAEVERCASVYGEAHKDNWGAVQLTEAEFRYMAQRMLRIANPELVLLAEIDGKVVGFSITLPDMNEAIAPLNGRLTTLGIPVGACRLIRRLRKVKSGRMLVLVVLQGYRRRGIVEMLILRSVEQGKLTCGITSAELGWTLEDNDAINSTIAAVGGQRYKVYRIYGKELTDSVASPCDPCTPPRA